MTKQRKSGILLHPTSLPGKWGIGDIGPDAYDFIDFLKSSGQRIWQVLPLGPTGYGDSPYQSLSAFAGNPMLISPDLLIEDGLLDKSLLKRVTFEEEHVDFASVIPYKQMILKKAYERFLATSPLEILARYEHFCSEHASWLEDFVLFAALKEHHENRPWTQWPHDLVKRRHKTMSKYSAELADEIDLHRFIQFLFFDQWERLHAYAAERDVEIIGDIPIFVAHDSSDVWSHQEWFQLDRKGEPKVVAGVPPDYFSATGQRWGNPLFDWKKLKKDNYSFWVKRFELLASMYDHIRIDHFRGFAGYWEIPASEETAINGRWKDGPGSELFHVIERELGSDVPVIAEDLGVITEDVTLMLEELGFPGLAVLQFGFEAVDDGLNSSSFLPHNNRRDQIVYTGTHDNDTVRGWWDKQPVEVQDFTRRYLNTDGVIIHRDMIRAAFSSVAAIAIFPLQDLFGLGSEGCMNRPGTSSGNWQWRFQKKMLTPEIANELMTMTRVYGRTTIPASGMGSED